MTPEMFTSKEELAEAMFALLARIPESLAKEIHKESGGRSTPSSLFATDFRPSKEELIKTRKRTALRLRVDCGVWFEPVLIQYTGDGEGEVHRI